MQPTRRLGSVLVALQFSLLAGLAAFALPSFLVGHASAGAWALVVAGLLLGLWALSSNRPGNFNIRPIPREGGQLVQTGPYRWIRHPMYTALIVAASGAALAGPNVGVWWLFAGLFATLWVKAVLEERWMLLAHPGYLAYQKLTRRFIPGVY